MRKHVIILLFAALCCCSPKENKTGITGEIPSLYLERKLYEFLPISNSFSEYKYIPLKETDDFLIGQVDKLIRTDSSYFIMDRDKTQTIYKYDLEGNPVNKFFHKGGSANEYTEIIDFDVDTASEEIVIFCVMPKIIYTDYNFNIKKTQILGYNYFDRIVSWDKKIYLYNDRHRVLACLDSKMEQPDTLIITKEMRADFIGSSKPAFFKHADNLYFQAIGDGCTYKLNGAQFEPYMFFDYENKKEAMEFFATRSPVGISIEEHVKYSRPELRCLFGSNNKTMYIYIYGMVHLISIFDITTSTYKTHLISMFIGTHGINCYNNILYAHNTVESLMQVIKSSSFEKYMQGVKYDVSKILNLDDEFGNPIIIEQILKNDEIK